MEIGILKGWLYHLVQQRVECYLFLETFFVQFYSYGPCCVIHR